MATVIKQQGKRGTSYKVRYRNPQGETRSKSFKVKALADAFARTVEDAKVGGTFVEQSATKLTYGEWHATWWAGLQGTKRRTTQQRDADYFRTLILPDWRHVPLGRIDHMDAQAWVAKLGQAKEDGGRGLAPATVAKALQLFKASLTSAVIARRLPVNPVAEVRPPVVRHHTDRYLTPEEVATLAAATPEPYRPMVYVMAYCGPRIGEVAALQVSDHDPMRRRLRISRTTQEVRGVLTVDAPKTKAGVRSVPMPAFVSDMLVQHCAGKAPTDPIFPAPQGGLLRQGLWRRRVWAPAVAQAGLAPLVPHQLRHTAVSLWIATGATVQELMAWAGHSKAQSVLDRYGHLLVSDDDRVQQRLDTLARNATSTDATVVRLTRGA